MSPDEIRIGHPPTTPRVPLIPTPAPPPRGPGPWIVGLAAVLLIAIAVATTAYLTGRADQAAAAGATPTLVALDEPTTCATLIPLLSEAADQIQAIADHPDGSTVKQPGVRGTLVGLEAIQPGAPAAMRGDIQAQIDALHLLDQVMSGTNTTLHLEGFRASGIRLASLCRNYAS